VVWAFAIAAIWRDSSPRARQWVGDESLVHVRNRQPEGRVRPQEQCRLLDPSAVVAPLIQNAGDRLVVDLGGEERGYAPLAGGDPLNVDLIEHRGDRSQHVGDVGAAAVVGHGAVEADVGRKQIVDRAL